MKNVYFIQFYFRQAIYLFYEEKETLHCRLQQDKMLPEVRYFTKISHLIHNFLLYVLILKIF